VQKFIKTTTLVTLLYSSSLLATDYTSVVTTENPVTTNLNPINVIENTVLTNNSGKYDITGYFAPYTFGSDTKSNWTFTFSSKYGGDTYQLLGDTSEENIQKMGIFGWIKKDVIPNDPMFYMVQYEPTPFGWLLFDIDENGNCKNIYKLAGQNPTTKSFSYDLDGDGKTDILDGLSCKVSGESVEFFSTETTDGITEPSVSTSDSTAIDTVDLKKLLAGKTFYIVAGSTEPEISEVVFNSDATSDTWKSLEDGEVGTDNVLIDGEYIGFKVDDFSAENLMKYVGQTEDYLIFKINADIDVEIRFYFADKKSKAEEYFNYLKSLNSSDTTTTEENISTSTVSDTTIDSSTDETTSTTVSAIEPEYDPTKQKTLFPGHTPGGWANNVAFAALKGDGTVVTWGDSRFGGNSFFVSNKLINVKAIYSTTFAFAALKEDGTVVTWGNSKYGGDSSSVAEKLTNVKAIYSTGSAFAALKEDGTVVTWGNGTLSVDYLIPGKLTNVKIIYSNYGAFAALKNDGTIVTWGALGNGGYSSIDDKLTNVKEIYPSYTRY